jgi:MSHA pilin protein MshA
MAGTVRQRAFTLIEVVVVIVILGILATVAVPRFAAIEVEARSAATSALGTRMRARASLAHSIWLAEGRPATVVIEGSTVEIRNGYPTEATIDHSLPGLEGFTYDAAGSPVVFLKIRDDQTAIANCAVTYSAPAAPGAAPSVTVDTAAC